MVLDGHHCTEHRHSCVGILSSTDARFYCGVSLLSLTILSIPAITGFRSGTILDTSLNDIEEPTPE